MTTRKIWLLLTALLSLILLSCSTAVKNDQDMRIWLSQAAHGYTKTRNVNGLKVTVRYLPPEGRALQELEQGPEHNQAAYQKLLEEYRYASAFVMTIGPDHEKGAQGDIMYRGLQNYQQYAERALQMNFDLETQVELVTDNGRKYKPVLSTMENTYGLKEERSVYFVFSPVQAKEELSNANNLDFVYEDNLFELGTLHFEFNKSELQDIPTIEIN